MWYANNGTKTLDYSKPIVAKNSRYTFLLLPVAIYDSYTTEGYDWFNITTGEWNSKVRWKTPQEAVQSYKNYKISNVVLNIKEI